MKILFYLILIAGLLLTTFVLLFQQEYVYSFLCLCLSVISIFLLLVSLEDEY